MDKIKSLWDEQRALFLLVCVLIVVVLVFLIVNPIWVLYLAVAGVVMIILWLTLDTVVKARKRKQQANLDQRIAAKEGLEDRKREWLAWSQELNKHGIDRYELPFYLLVGEPQSGKSILLQNSGLNFPLGQNKLSGPGGTRGCDWWFTEEAVVLDLAGRLFTHEGGQSDATEWEAFLGLLAAYRPLSPANGILLVIPCDSLLQDSAEVTAQKATRIQESLMTLVDKLEAQLPIYVVLTKADKVFGFAESVHRLDAERRRQMFGWSRSADNFEKPFSLPEFREAFERLRTRAHLMRAGAMSSAQVPDALPEIDRLYAFPEELGSLSKPLEAYMQRIFSESALLERLFFRGLYLTSGLQQGAPIAQACAELMGSKSEADARNLEGLFTKQRSYFIQDFIQRRVFAERGLVRPTSSRVHKSRKMAMMGYGSAAAITILGTLWFGYSTLSSGSPEAFGDYQVALATTKDYVQTDVAQRDLKGLLTTLDAVHGAIQSDLPSVDSAFSNNISDFKNLHRELCTTDLGPLVRKAAEGILAKSTHQSPKSCNFLELEDLTIQLDFLLGTMPVGPAGEEAPIGGFSLAEESHRMILEEILLGDAELSEYFKPKKDREGKIVGESVFAVAMVIHAEDDGGFVLSKWDSSSGQLAEAAQGLAGLYDALLSDTDFAAGVLPPALETYHLERLVAAHRYEATLRSTAELLSGKSAPSCDAILASKAKYDSAVRGLRDFVKDYKTVARDQYWAEYASANTRLLRVLGAASVTPPASWSGLEDYASSLLEGTSAGKTLVSWKKLAEDRAPTGAFPRAPRGLNRLRNRLSAQWGVDVKGVLSGSATKEGAPAPAIGDLAMVVPGEVPKILGLDQAAMSKILGDCEENLLDPSFAANPVALFSIAGRIWAEEANPTSTRSKWLVGRMQGLQETYSEFYTNKNYSYDSLSNALNLSTGDDSNSRQFGLHLPAAEHLLGMHLLLTQMDAVSPGFRPWMDALKLHIEPLLRDAVRDQAAVSASDFATGSDARYVGALATAWKIGSAFKSQTSDLIGDYLKKKRSGLLYEWEGMERFEAVMASLRNHLQTERLLLDAGYFTGQRETDRSTWLKVKVDGHLLNRLETFDEEVRLYWHEAARVDGDDLKSVSREVNLRLAAGFESDARNKAQKAPDYGTLKALFTEVDAALGEDPTAPGGSLPVSRKSLAALNSVDLEVALKNAQKALEEKEFEEVLDLTDRLRGRRSRDVSTEDKAVGLVSVIYALQAVRTDVAGDVGLLYLKETLLHFHASLHEDLEELYEADFKKQILAAHRETLDSELFRVKGEVSLNQVTVGDVEDLLRDVVKLRQSYRRANLGEGWPADEVALLLHPFKAGTPDQEWDDFLYALALMFGDALEDGLEEYEFSFKLAPDSKKNFWSNRGRLENGENLTRWWPLGANASVDVKADAKPHEEEWRLGSKRDLYMAWGKALEAPAENSGLSLSLKGAFAPLALAWHYGALEQDEERRFQLNIALSETITGKETIPVRMTVPEGFPDLPATDLPKN